MKFIDIHSHHAESHDHIIKMRVFDPLAKDFDEAEFKKTKYKCLGVHPWNLHRLKKPKVTIENIHKLLQGTDLILGEIGLDKSIAIPLEEQISFFKQCVQLIGPKVIVLHCVRSYQEIYNALNEIQYKNSLLFHDYNNNEQTADQFLNKFETYFSFGHSLFRKNSKSIKTLTKLPINRIFFETDDQTRYNIEKIYTRAQEITGRDNLVEICYQNFIDFYKMEQDEK